MELVERKKKGRLKMLEESLASQIEEFKADLSDKNLQSASRSGSSLGHMKTVEQYSKDRELSLQHLLTIPRPKPMHCQFNAMLEEVELCLKPIFTPQNLPIKLNQFFLDRLQQLVQLKHQLLLRWSRFVISRPKLTEEIAEDFQKRMKFVMIEHNDALNRSKRLSVSCDSLLSSSKSSPNNLVMYEDVLLFLRWLVYHQHISKRATSIISTLQWFPVMFEDKLSLLIRHKQDPEKLQHGPKGINRRHSDATKKWIARKQSMSSDKEVESNSAAHCMASSLRESLESGRSRSCHVPYHQIDMSKNSELLQELMLNYNIVGPASFPGLAEELQFFYQVTRKFNLHFQAQEMCSTLHTYDRPPESEGSMKINKSKLVFRKPSNWVPFIRVYVTPDPVQIKTITKMKQLVPHVDPLLLLSSQCTHLKSPQRVLYALRQHSVMVHNPSPLISLSVTSHKTSHDTLLIWKCIYSGLDSRNPLCTGDSEESEIPLSEPVMAEDSSNALNTSNLDMPNAMKVILNHGARKISAKAKEKAAKDSYMGFLILRHLRIRDLRAKCLSILNYFRSIERTLTINMEGLSLEHNYDQKTRKSTGLLNHAHLFNTPADFCIDQSDFMRYMEVENHDDFFNFSDDGTVQVRDQRGVTIMYDSALEDLKEVEHELMRVGTLYMNMTTLKQCKKTPLESEKVGEDSDMEHLSQRNIDRFGVLLDLWASEAQYLQAKMKVVNCYFEAYQHTLDLTQRTKLHQAMVTCMQARPRYNLDDTYFISTYRKEVQCMELLSQLLLTVIKYQMTEERAYNLTSCKKNIPDNPMETELDASSLPFGLPHPLLQKQLVSLTGDRHLQVHSYLMEFSESLYVLGDLAQAIQWSLTEASVILHTESPADIVSLHCKLLELTLTEWENSAEIGSSYAKDINQMLFCSEVVEDPSSMTDVLLTHSDVDARTADNPNEVHMKITKAWMDVLQLICLRYHFIVTTLEAEFLTRLYKKQLISLESEECHAHLRFIIFDQTVRFPPDKDLDYFVSRNREDIKGGNARLDRYARTKLRLAIHELDEHHVGEFSFKTFQDIMKILSRSGGLQCIKVSLKAEVAHRNALLMACQQNAIIIRNSLPLTSQSKGDRPRSARRSPRGSICTTPTNATPSFGYGLEKEYVLRRELWKYFISVQQEKAPVQDYMLAKFTKQPNTILKNTNELVNIKCSLISQFSSDLTLVMSIHSLRLQTIRHYDGIIKLLNDFPATREAHFIIGEVKTNEMAEYAPPDNIILDPSKGFLHKRVHNFQPHQLLTEDGRLLMNLWYIPHFSEVMTMFDEIPVEKRCQNMMKVLRIASGLHCLLQYMCAYVSLGRASGPLGEVSQGFGGMWGGVESIGSELVQLQSEISHLHDACDPKEVADYLEQRCQVAFYQHDLTVRYYLRKSLLSTENSKELKTLDSVSIPACLHLSHVPLNPYFLTHYCNIHYPHHAHLPHPLNFNYPEASTVVPWQSFSFNHGLFPTALDHSSQIGSFVYASLSVLDREGQNMAHGELLGMSLLLEDVLRTSDLGVASIDSHPDISHKISSEGPHVYHQTNRKQKPELWNASSQPSSLHTAEGRPLSFSISRASSSASTTVANLPPTTLNVIIPPIEGTMFLERFLVLTSQLEQLKTEWGLKLLNCRSICTQKLSKDLDDMYRSRVLTQARKVVAKMQSRDLARKLAEEEANETSSMLTFMTEFSSLDTGGGNTGHAAVAMAHLEDSLNEYKLREAQVSILIDILDQVMIGETSKYLSKLHHLLLNERERDDTVLPLDLWKTNAMNFKELTGISRSHVVEDFATMLQYHMKVEQGKEGEGVVSISMKDLKDCLHALSSGVLAREKECYQLYASFYETLLRSQYNQLFLKNQDIEHYKILADSYANQSREDALCFMGEHTQDMIMEITALRNKLSHFKQYYAKELEVARRQAIMEYSALVDELFSATLSVKNKFEDYRGKLYNDMTQSLSEVRQSVSESIIKVKEKLGLKEREPETKGIHAVSGAGALQLKGEAIKNIQDDNAELNKMLIRMKAVYNWNRHKAGVTHNTELISLKGKLTSAHMEYLTLQMTSEEEILSLKQQVQVMQKHLDKVERECEIAKQNLKEEKQKKLNYDNLISKSHDIYPSKAERSYAAKLEYMVQEMEEKDQMMKLLEEEQDRVLKYASMEKIQSTKAMRGMKQQLHHERNLKLGAFHQVDDLLLQVQQLEDHHVDRGICSVNKASPKGSPYYSTSISIGSTPRVPTPTIKIKQASASHLGVNHSRPQQQTRSARLPGKNDRIDLGQEILALKLI